jgi:2-methylisocitrate lyase-like PEP mutase family enzyme
MSERKARAKRFADLHVRGDPLILFNIWDPGSAKAIAEVGAKAIATGSWSVAAAHGYDDGEQMPFDLVLANVRRIVAAVSLPVTIDLEGGYGITFNEVKQNVSRVIDAGAVGINFEDQVVGGIDLYPIGTQCERIAGARDAGGDLFINARTDVFLKAKPADHDQRHLDEAIRRASAYTQAGASGFFAPGLRNAAAIDQLCAAVSLPVNIMFLPDAPPPRELADLGVARVSYGPRPYRQMISALKDAGRNALSHGVG